MFKKALILITALCGTQAFSGPISKFNEKVPDLETVSSVSLYDLERCLTDLDGWLVPFIYRQPDRPSELRMLWVGGNGITAGRADLKATPEGVSVKMWNVAGKQARSCVLKGTPR